MAPATLGRSHHLIQKTVAYGRPYGSKALRDHTYCYSQSSTTNNEQPYTPTSKANTSTSSGEPSKKTHSPRNCSTHSYNTSWNPLTEKWNRGNPGVKLVKHNPDTNLNLRFEDDILLISGSLEHTTTMLDDLTTATTAHGLQLLSTKTAGILEFVQRPICRQ